MKNTLKTLKRRPVVISCLLLTFLFLILSCRKEFFNGVESKVLSEGSKDYLTRLKAIKDKFYSHNLEEKLTPNTDKNIKWEPDWNNSISQIINDSVSYVFYPLKGYLIKDGKRSLAKILGARPYLIVKNEKEFYKGLYYQPNDQSNLSGVQQKEIVVTHFSGNLLLTNLETKNAFLLHYKDGIVVNDQLKNKMAYQKLMSVDRSTSYFETQCRTEINSCTYYTGSYSCGGGIVIEYSFTCQEPTYCQNSIWILSDYNVDQICEQVWFPDPPTDPGDGSGGGSGASGEEFNPVTIEPIITIDSNTRPCIDSLKNAIVNASEVSVTIANLLKQVNNDYTKAQNAILALANNPNLKITIGEKSIPYLTITNPDGTTSIKETHGETNPITGNIKLNTLMLNEATNLAIAATLIHEMMHSYFVWGANNLTGDQAMAFSDLNRYLFDQETGIPHPYNYPELSAAQHMQMAETYVNSMANILAGVAGSLGVGASPDSSISLGEYCRDIFWGSLQQTSGLEAPNPARSKANSNKEYKNQSGSTRKKGC